MLCDCSCDLDNENTFETQQTLVARKQWKCRECGEAIEPGERHQLDTLLCEDDWSKIRTCLMCARIRADLCDCWIFGNLKKTIWDCMGFDYLTGEENPEWKPRGQLP